MAICEPSDIAALWACRGLQRRGVVPLEVISPEALVCSLRWEHRINAAGTSVAMTLGSQRRVLGSQLRGVLNRAYTVPVALWHHATAADKLYVQQEFSAFFLSWLHSLPCPVFNRPMPFGLAGQWRSEAEWVYLVGKAGLPAPVYRQSSSDRIDEAKGERRLIPATASSSTVIVVGNATTGAAVPPAIADGCRRLAEMTATKMLGVDFRRGPDGLWIFAGATLLPELRAGGEALLDALAAELKGGTASS